MEPIRILTDDQMAQIDAAAQTILEQTGMIIDSEEALDLLEKAGCAIDRATSLVKFPRKLVQETIARMRKGYDDPDRPERMPVRYSHVRFRRTPHQVHQDFTVSAGGFNCFLVDLNGNRRMATREDVLCAINMVNGLDDIDLTGLPVSDQTVPADDRPVVMAATLAKYTRKIGGIETFRVEDVHAIHEIAQVVAGSEENLRAHPALVGYAEVRSPLCFDRNMVEIFMEYIKLGVPQTVDTMPAGGSTAPMTGAGVLALGAAETIAPMVLAYAIDENAVVGMDILPSYTDMSSGLYQYAAPERLNLIAARVQLLSEYYGCPTGVHGGKTDSCFMNEQTGAEKMGSMLMAVLSGAVAVGTVGHVENAVTFSPVQLVIDNEIARAVRRMIREPIEVSEETLATDLIHTVGPSGNFLGESHTAEHFRDELLLSPLFTTQAYEQAHATPEQFDTVPKATEIARGLWTPVTEPVLDDDQVKAIDAIVASALTS